MVALRAPIAADILEIEQSGARDARHVDTRMLVEVLVFGGDEGVDHALGDSLDRDIEPALVGILGEQGSVGGMDPRHHRRLIVLQLRIVRQILGEMPNQPGGAADPDDKKEGARCEQKAEKTNEQPHEGFTSTLDQQDLFDGGPTSTNRAAVAVLPAFQPPKLSYANSASKVSKRITLTFGRAVLWSN